MKQIKILLGSRVPPGVLETVPDEKRKVYKAHPSTVQLIGMEAKGEMTDEKIEEVLSELVKRKEIIIK